MNVLLEMLSYPFLQRALLAGVLISVCASLLGVSLVLKRYSMIGDGLSHVGFGALAIATAAGLSPLGFTIPVVVLVAVFLLRLKGGMEGDWAIGMLSTGSLALGVLVVSLNSGMNTDVSNYLFGSILAIRQQDLILSVLLCAVCLVLFLFFYHHMFAVTFDETFAQATGIPAGVYNTLMACLTAVTVVLGMKMMGALLISACMIFPALTAMRLCKTFRSVTICSVILSLISFLTGLVLSYVYAIPTGAGIVLVSMAMFLLFSFLALFKQ